MKKILIVMCGIPASGKSTVTKKLSRWLGDIPAVSMDNIREEWFGTRKCQDRGDEIYAQSIEDVLFAFEYYNIVIYDATNRTKKARKKLVETICKYYNCLIYCVYMATPLDTAIERNKNRDKNIQVPEAVIRRMYATLDPPTEEEKYFEKIFNFTPEVLDESGDMLYNILVNQIKGDIKL